MNEAHQDIANKRPRPLLIRLLLIIPLCVAAVLGLSLWWYSSTADLRAVRDELRALGLQPTWQELPQRVASDPARIAEHDELLALLEALIDAKPHFHGIDRDWQMGDPVDEEMWAYHGEVDEDEVWAIVEQLQALAARPPLVREEPPSLERLLSGLSLARRWAYWVQDRLWVEDDPERIARLIVSIDHALHLEELDSSVALRIQVAIWSISYRVLLEHGHRLGEYQEKVLAVFASWTDPERLHQQLIEGLENDLRHDDHLFATLAAGDQDPGDSPYDHYQGNKMLRALLIRLGRGPYLQTQGRVAHQVGSAEDLWRGCQVLRQQAQDLEELLVDATWYGSPRRLLLREIQWRTWEQLSYYLVACDLVRQAVEHELGLGPWPSDPFDPAAGPMRSRRDADGRLLKIWSIGPERIEHDGEDRGLILPLRDR